jgi:pimeloyl-ACP methyl ester carboxylesterase
MQARERIDRLEALKPTYAGDEQLAWPAGGFLRPGPDLAPASQPLRTPWGEARDLSWPSAYEVANPLVVDKLDPSGPNGTARARIYPAGTGPAVVAIHGYGAGWPRLEPLAWPLRAWRDAGVTVALPTLPFHGPRKPAGERMPPFPGLDPRFTNDGFRQAVHDLTALIGWLRSQGYGPISLAGMSLGGYTAALLATLLPELASVSLIIPLASLADFARLQGRLGGGESADALHAGLEAVYRPTSPLSRPPRIAPERVRIWATRGDRITGVAHAERLGRHFGVEPTVVPGSHLVQTRLPWDEVVRFGRS